MVVVVRGLVCSVGRQARRAEEAAADARGASDRAHEELAEARSTGASRLRG